ncbi:unnamed protein product, partial [marine sediment metagenome]
TKAIAKNTYPYRAAVAGPCCITSEAILSNKV